VGGVRGRAGARTGGSNLRRLACRSGGRHPGHRDGGALRGAPSERVTSVGPSCCRGHPPTAEGAPTTADVRRSPRRGTPSRMRSKHMHPAQAREIDCLRLRRRVLRSVLRPVRVDPHYARTRSKGASVVRRSDRYHGWANPREWEEPALGPNGRALAARRVSPLPRGRGRGTSEKEGGRGLRPCEDCRARVWLPARRVSLQKSVGGVGPQISSANALQKERSGSSERGSSPERKSARENVGCPRRAKKTS